MKRTPKEIANSPKQEQASWLLDPATTPRNILEFDHLTSATVDIHALSRAALSVRISEVAEVSTRRIVMLTWALVALTAALLIFTVYLYKDTHALVEREQTSSPNQQIGMERYDSQ